MSSQLFKLCISKVILSLIFTLKLSTLLKSENRYTILTRNIPPYFIQGNWILKIWIRYFVENTFLNLNTYCLTLWNLLVVYNTFTIETKIPLIWYFSNFVLFWKWNIWWRATGSRTPFEGVRLGVTISGKPWVSLAFSFGTFAFCAHYSQQQSQALVNVMLFPSTEIHYERQNLQYYSYPKLT